MANASNNQPKILGFIKRIFDFKNEKGPNTDYWQGASFGLLLFSFSIGLWTATNSTFGVSKFWILLASIGIALISFIIFPILATLISRFFDFFPKYFLAAVVAAMAFLIVLKNVRLSLPDVVFYIGMSLAFISLTFLFGGLWSLFSGSIKTYQQGKRVLIVFGVLLGGSYFGYVSYWLFGEGDNPYHFDFKQSALPEAFRLELTDPSQKGPFEVLFFSYGSGTNLKRPEFGAEADYISEVVNGQYILPQWKGKQAEKRSEYWGFGVDEWPLNGLVCMPKGEGPFPMVLIAHGNHNMEEFSDPGYAYLGELLASRGFITVSVDENFINGSWVGDFRGKELPARAWLLLKHLEQWKKWDTDPLHALNDKADLNRVALIGHSRGGEAVPIAAAFNQLSHFPDDARETFNFGFGIKSVIAIAPTDYRYDRRVTIANVDYLGIQGSYDSDEDSFFGLRQLQRTVSTDSSFHFNSGIYIHGANHGQFNTIWGRHDAGFPYKYFLNTEPMISEEDQRKYAEVLISAFLEASILEKKEYTRVFQDLRQAGSWLPDNVLALSLYEDSGISYWADFEEDIELQTVGAGLVSAEGFEVWAEDYLQFRGGKHQENHALVLGWQQDSVSTSARYTLKLDGVASLDSTDYLTFAIGSGNPSLLDDVATDSLDNDLKVILTDRSGSTSTLLLSDYFKIAPQLKIRFLKTKTLTTERYGNEWEPVLETVFIPRIAFDHQGIDYTQLSSIAFEMSKSTPGIVFLDRIGIRKE